MEIFFILPILIGLGIYSLFDSGSSDSGSNVGNNDDTPVSPPAVDTDNVFMGSGSADTISGGTGKDFIEGGSGADNIEGNKDNDIILGQGDNDVIFGGRGYDLILGGTGSDTLYGLAGEDTLIGGAGRDLIRGGDGADVLVGSNGADTLEGDDGNDVISGYDIDANTSALQVNMVASTAQSASTSLSNLETFVNGQFADDAASAGTTIASLVNSLKSAFNENSSGNIADDLLKGGTGNDTILADYSDTITGGAGKDVLYVNSDGANQVVTVTDFNPAEDKLNIFVPANTAIAFTLVNGATALDGVSVVVAGDVVAKLTGLTAANITAGSIVVKNA